MKRCIYLLVMVMLTACKADDVSLAMYDVIIRLQSEQTDTVNFGSGISVQLKDSHASISVSQTDSTGCAHFSVPAGLYEANVSRVTEDDYFKTIYNGALSSVIVGEAEHTEAVLPVNVTVVQNANPILIKEIYVGGCDKDDGSGAFHCDKCMILYNNSSHKVSIDNLAIGICEPYNAEASAHNFLVNGTLVYADQDWLPCINGIWYFQGTLEIEPYTEVVVNIHGAIDNTLTYSKSVNYANPDYYCMYDPEAASSDGIHYSNTLYYPTPSEVIPTSHYLKAVKYGKSNSWPCSQSSPALVLFQTSGITPKEYAENSDNIVYPSNYQGNLVYACLRVPRQWIIDGVEMYNSKSESSCKKRLTSDIDNGYVLYVNSHGHSVIRNINSEATAKAGHNVYQDTNNSTNDFYEAEKCSLCK